MSALLSTATALSPLALLQGASGGSNLLTFVPLILIFAIFYFLVIMPSRKRQKELGATIEALTKGDKVVTTGGIFGEVVSVDKATLVMKISENVKVKVSKTAITGLQGDPAAEAKP